MDLKFSLKRLGFATEYQTVNYCGNSERIRVHYSSAVYLIACYNYCIIIKGDPVTF